MPGSRSNSPPIRLPPLKGLPGTTTPASETVANFEVKDRDRMRTDDEDEAMQSSNGVSTGDMAMDKEKVELPGFSEFEAAATRGHLHHPLSPVGLSSNMKSNVGSPTGLGPSVLGPITSAATDSRMSIDFVR